MAEVVAERELHVHVQAETLGQEKRVVGYTVARHSVDRLVAPVVHPVDEPGQTQDVVGHAFAPLAASRRARERLAQRLCALRQCPGAAARLGELRAERTRALAAIRLHRVQQRGEPAELAAHLRDLPVDERPLARELARRGLLLGAEHLVVHPHQLLDRPRQRGTRVGVAGGIPRARRARTNPAAQQQDTQRRDDRQQHRH